MAWLPPRKWEPLAVVPIVAGGFWLLGGSGWGWWLCALAPGVLQLSAGTSLLLWPGDLRHTEFLAVGSLLGGLLALPAMAVSGIDIGFACLLLSLCCYLLAGRLALAREPATEGAPEPERAIAMDAKVALDEALLGYFVGSARVASGEHAQRMVADTFRFERVLEERGWLEHPPELHREPPAPERVESTRGRIYGQDYERVRWRSGFVAPAELPGAQWWANRHRNNQASALVVRHADAAARPWLVCIHGYRMGYPWMDFGLFPPGWLHRRLGLNLLLPTLPAHGARRVGPRTGDFYLDGDLYNVVLAQSQALWDLRRALRWIRAQDPRARIGVLGYSLGGYNTALLACYEPELDFVVAGIPVIDFAAALYRHMPPDHVRYLQSEGLDEQRFRKLLQVVSPLKLAPRVGVDSRYIFAGAGDRVVLPEQPLQLARHWQVPVQWYQGGHLTFRGEFVVRAHIEAAMKRAGWAAQSVPGFRGSP